MEKEMTWIVRYDMAGFVRALNSFFKRLGHYQFIDIYYGIDERDINNRRYSALITHQKIN